MRVTSDEWRVTSEKIVVPSKGNRRTRGGVGSEKERNEAKGDGSPARRRWEMNATSFSGKVPPEHKTTVEGEIAAKMKKWVKQTWQVY